MPAKRHDIEALFAPPEGLHGTHALLCGLSAEVPVLERALAAFTCETPVERQASGLLRGLLLLDASSPRIPPSAVPGLLHMAPCPVADWRKRTTLLHAKVALLGFGSSRCSAPSQWRLIVSTGNWTEATWARQVLIDFFWQTEWTLGDKDDAQALVDIAAAFSFFQRMIESLYGDHMKTLQKEALAAGWLDIWSKELRKSLGRTVDPPLPQFIHSLDTSLAVQVRKRFPDSGVNTLVAGSGFFEKAVPGDLSQPKVLSELETLGRPGTRHLIYNPSQAGQIANWVGAQKGKSSTVGKWQLCQPLDPLKKKAAPGRAFLHAKFIAAIGRLRNDSGKINFVYVGSGNLSHKGYMTAARLEGRGNPPPGNDLGNVEAGVALASGEKPNNVWKRLACGNLVTGTDIANTVSGPGEQLFAPQEPPPVLLVRHQLADKNGSGSLLLERSAGIALSVWVKAADIGWEYVAADATSLPWPSSVVPAVVRVRDRDPGEGPQQEWEVPVFSADGLYCKRPVPQMPFGSVLEALLDFPAPPSHLTEEDDEEQGGGGAQHGGRQKASRYPLRNLAAMIEMIANRNEVVTREEFPYWLSQLRVLLLEQSTDADKSEVRALGVDLFDALFEPGFKPRWLDKHKVLEQQYIDVVNQLRAGWCASSGE